MEFFIFFAFGFAFHILKTREQKRRINLLASHLGKFEIEKLMEGLASGYLRALGEASAERQAQVFAYLEAQEAQLSEQVQQFSIGFVEVWGDSALSSTLPLAFPWADKLFPKATFDVRKAFQIHARGIADTVRNSQQAQPKDRAYMLTAEILLMQHTCHWFCRSKTVASARLLARHQTRYEQVLSGVSASTRQGFAKLLTPVA
ncbi:MAG: hypothetical protein RL682_43 [Pseudomonadota bacterium]|jgi:hypothetical protein